MPSRPSSGWQEKPAGQRVAGRAAEALARDVLEAGVAAALRVVVAVGAQEVGGLAVAAAGEREKRRAPTSGDEGQQSRKRHASAILYTP